MKERGYRSELVADTVSDGVPPVRGSQESGAPGEVPTRTDNQPRHMSRRRQDVPRTEVPGPIPVKGGIALTSAGVETVTLS